MTTRHPTCSLAGGSLRSVTNPLSVAPVVLDVALHPGFYPKVNESLAGAARLLSNEYFVTPPGAKPRLGWHRDATDQNFATLELASSLLLVNCLVLLSDVAPENGPDARHPRVSSLAVRPGTAGRLAGQAGAGWASRTCEAVR